MERIATHLAKAWNRLYLYLKVQPIHTWANPRTRLDDNAK